MLHGIDKKEFSSELQRSQNETKVEKASKVITLCSGAGPDIMSDRPRMPTVRLLLWCSGRTEKSLLTVLGRLGLIWLVKGGHGLGWACAPMFFTWGGLDISWVTLGPCGFIGLTLWVTCGPGFIWWTPWVIFGGLYSRHPAYVYLSV